MAVREKFGANGVRISASVALAAVMAAWPLLAPMTALAGQADAPDGAAQFSFTASVSSLLAGEDARVGVVDESGVLAGSYADLSEALACALPGQTVRLFSDVSPAYGLPIDKDIVLDLNGHRIDDEMLADSCLLSASDANVVIRSGTLRTSVGTALRVMGGSQVTLENATIKTAGYEHPDYYDPRGEAVEVSGGTFTVAKGASVLSGSVSVRVVDAYSVVDIYGTVETRSVLLGVGSPAVGGYDYAANSFVNVGDGASVVSDRHFGIAQSWDGTVNVTGGRVAGASGIGAKSGRIAIVAGDIAGTAPRGWESLSPYELVPTGSALVIDDFDNAAHAGMSVTVSGGRLESLDAYAIQEVRGSVGAPVSVAVEGGRLRAASGLDVVCMNGGQAVVSGGAFSSDVSALCAPGRTVRAMGEGWYRASADPLSIAFLGGSLRMNELDALKNAQGANMRFGYEIDLPSGATIDWRHTGWRFAVGRQVEASDRFHPVACFARSENETLRTNMVLTGIPAESYGSEVHVRMQVAYTTAEGRSVVETDAVDRVRSVRGIADSIMQTSNSERERAYAYLISQAGCASKGLI